MDSPDTVQCFSPYLPRTVDQACQRHDDESAENAFHRFALDRGWRLPSKSAESFLLSRLEEWAGPAATRAGAFPCMPAGAESQPSLFLRASRFLHAFARRPQPGRPSCGLRGGCGRQDHERPRLPEKQKLRCGRGLDCARVPRRCEGTDDVTPREWSGYRIRLASRLLLPFQAEFQPSRPARFFFFKQKTAY